METQRQEYFKQLRPSCVELSSVALKFRTRQSSQQEVLRALNGVHDALVKVIMKDGLDEKLAEYAFFPLSQVFNQIQNLTSRCVELSVKCLRLLVDKGWREHLAPEMGKQLLILLTILVGGTPAQNKRDQPRKSTPEDLDEVVFDCIGAVCNALHGPIAANTIFNEIGSATIIDQTVYILLEGLNSSPSDAVQKSAASSLSAMCSRITDRVVLASIMPRIVSTLAKVIKPSTQARRSFRLLESCLKALTEILKFCLRDNVALSDLSQKENASKDNLVLDESWLKATAAQVKLALSNVTHIRRHERKEVKAALMDLCLMVIEDCQESLSDSLPLMVETLVILAEVGTDNSPSESYSALRHIIITYDYVADTLRELLQTWIMAFSRTMLSNDEIVKQRAIRQISTAYRVLSEYHANLQLLDSNMTSALCDSLATIVGPSKLLAQPVFDFENFWSGSKKLPYKSETVRFSPIFFERTSQRQTLDDLKSMIDMLNNTASAGSIARLIMNQLGNELNNSSLASFWLAVQFLQASAVQKSGFDEFTFIDETQISSLVYTQSSLVEELYSYSLEILNKPHADLPADWRITALALEAVAMQAQQLGAEFRDELMDALYSVLQVMASPNPNLRNHAITCLNILTSACKYPDASMMIIDNVDYLVNSVGLKLNTFDVSPYPAQVLLMMVRLCGASLVPYLDDLVDSIFGIIDMYHGYPKLVELLFLTLGAIVDESVKAPMKLAITASPNSQFVNHRKGSFVPLPVVQLVQDFAERKRKRHLGVNIFEDGNEERLSHPKRPWTENLDEWGKQKEEPDNVEETVKTEDTDELLPSPSQSEDNENPLSKSFSLLLHIVKSTPKHLTSPSPFLRRSLLSLLTKAIPVIARQEGSFLPLVNDIWPTVNARITSSASLSLSSDYILDLSLPRSTSLDLRNVSRKPKEIDQFDFKEEVFVIEAACSTVTIMSEYAGDFLSTRVEQEFPRWRRIYKQAWNKVSADADRSAEHRKLLLDKKDLSIGEKGKPVPSVDRPAAPSRSSSQTLDLASGLSLVLESVSSSLQPLTPSAVLPAISRSAARPFTAHHTLWRGLTSMFISFLLHIRLPFPIGDDICESLGSWIVKFAGANFYFDLKTRRRKGHNLATSQESPSLPSPATHPTTDLEIVLQAITAMETWNKDLTWFIFVTHRSKIIPWSHGNNASSTTNNNGPDDIYNSLQSIKTTENLAFAAPVF